MPWVYLVGSGRYGFGLTHPLDCHVYLVQGQGQYALIDSGVGLEVDAILRQVRDDGLDPAQISTILITHSHADHAGGAARLAQLTGAQVIASRQAAPTLRTGDMVASGARLGQQAGIYPGDYQLTPCSIAREVSDGDLINVGDIEFTVLETPGHCRDHLAFYARIEGKPSLFGGDSVFHSGRILIQNIPDCSLPEYSRTAQRLAALEVDALLTGHLTIALSGGHEHLQAAADAFQALRIPPNAL
ncbi:MAG: MBL fold metallo-hydrolase [Deinococcus sp.]|nr:MBL fold metallo-hydrolase [Deinococcus sp.]